MRNKLNKGQSLFEVMFALSVAAMILVAVVALVATSIRNSTFSKNKALANKYASELSEWLKKERNNGWNSFSQQLGTTDSNWCMVDLLWTGQKHSCAASDFITSTIFKRQMDVTAGTNSYEFSITVTWSDGLGDHETKSTTVLTDWNQQ